MTVWEKLFGRRDLPKQKVEEGEGSRDSSHQAPVENDSSCQEYPEIVNPKDGAKMVFVPAGGFLMGSSTGDGDARLDEKPQHEVYLDGYWIYKYPVTVGQYREFSQATGRIMPDAPFSEWTDSHPVMQNDWDEAKAYCDWAGVFLPTEAQWEKAARGTTGRIYPWGDRWDQTKCANSQNADGRYGFTGSRPVGSFADGASPYSAMDMVGNIRQWCSDWYLENYYSQSPADNPSGPTVGEHRVLRGGSFYIYAGGADAYCDYRCATRCNFDLLNWGYVWFGVGFRAVCVFGKSA